MAGIATWLRLMPDTVTIQVPSAVDAYGDETVGTAVTYRARVAGPQQLSGNQQIVSRHTVYLGANVVLQPNATIRLSSGLVNSTDETALSPPILQVVREPDQFGTHHTKILLG